MSIYKWPSRWLVPSPIAIWPDAFAESLSRHEEAAFVDRTSVDAIEASDRARLPCLCPVCIVSITIYSQRMTF